MTVSTGHARGSIHRLLDRGMAAYLWRHKLIERPTFVAQQGHWMGRPGEAQVQVQAPPEAISGVQVCGYADLVIRGEIQTPVYKGTIGPLPW